MHHFIFSSTAGFPGGYLFLASTYHKDYNVLFFLIRTV